MLLFYKLEKSNRTLTLIESVSGAVDGRVGHRGTWTGGSLGLVLIQRQVMQTIQCAMYKWLCERFSLQQCGIRFVNNSVDNLFKKNLTNNSDINNDSLNESVCRLLTIVRGITEWVQFANESVYSFKTIQQPVRSFWVNTGRVCVKVKPCRNTLPPRSHTTD